MKERIKKQLKKCVCSNEEKLFNLVGRLNCFLTINYLKQILVVVFVLKYQFLFLCQLNLSKVAIQKKVKNGWIIYT
jgi:hypothetical protein